MDFIHHVFQYWPQELGALACVLVGIMLSKQRQASAGSKTGKSAQTSGQKRDTRSTAGSSQTTPPAKKQAPAPAPTVPDLPPDQPVEFHARWRMGKNDDDRRKSLVSLRSGQEYYFTLEPGSWLAIRASHAVIYIFDAQQLHRLDSGNKPREISLQVPQSTLQTMSIKIKRQGSQIVISATPAAQSKAMA